MVFIMIRGENTADRIKIGTLTNEWGGTVTVSAGVVIQTNKDFQHYGCNSYQIVKETDSVQFRPKVLHKDKHGIFYKCKMFKIYLTEAEQRELEKYICFAQQKLKEMIFLWMG